MRALLLILTVVAVTPLEAIPPFARRYGMTCMSCHDPVPRLNAFGEAFAARGFTLMDDDTTGASSYGDPLLSVNTVFPAGVRFDAYFRWRTGSGSRADFQSPYTVKLLSGGPVARNISYYLYLMLAENGTIGALEDAWVMFRAPFGVPADITFGQFQVIDPLWKRETRITLEDYAVLRARPGTSAAGLTYDRGIIVSGALSGSTGVFLELVNGNGIAAAGATGEFDSDASKAGALIVTQAVGPFQLGLLGYYGRQAFTPTAGPAARSTTRMIGPMVRWEGSRVSAGAQYLYRDDSDPAFAAAGTPRVTTTGGFAELLLWPRGRGTRVVVAGLYNQVRSDDPSIEVETATFNASYLAARNVRLAAETTWDLFADRGTVALGVVTAF